MKKLLVAFQGERGAFSEEAIFNLLGDRAESLPCANFDEMFRALLEKRADYALAPMKNSLFGEITRTNELLAENNLRVVDTYKMHISLALIGCEATKFEDLRTVVSHYVALGQCRNFFKDNPQLTQKIGADTASSVRKMVDSRDLTQAAIASKRTVQIYGGKVLRENLQDVQDNFTTFYLLGN
jgi:prephenate dehydratase